ncbi:MAG TPA: Ig-like domain-containing protein [Cytophagaceae bacterium]|jgi:hypothetical protein
MKLSLTIIIVFTSLLVYSQSFPYKANEKKIITLQLAGDFDWAPDLAKNLKAMQANRPYMDGVAFHIGPDESFPNLAFNNEVWTEQYLKFPDLASIASQANTFTDNFIIVFGHSRNVPPDFFNDNLWAQIYKNTQLLGKAVKTGKCKGIMFDPEFYSAGETYSPWWFTKSNAKGTPPYKGKSFDLVKAKARQRGKEYVQALQTHMPAITIMTTFLYAMSWDYCYGDINKLPDSEYALLPSFADGMLEALNEESILIDGNEPSYYISDSKEYINSGAASYYHVRLEAIPKVCDPTLLNKWNKQGQVAMAPYLEYCYNRHEPNSWSTPSYQSQWMAHNVYNSLLATDQYVWTYIESMNFWTNANAPENVNALEDIESAVKKFRNDEALGYDMYNIGTGASQFISTPLVTITSPANSTSINVGGDITITAEVNPTSSISKVEFYANSLKIGEKSSPPYTIKKTLEKQNYTLFARAVKIDGSHNSSGPIHLVASNITEIFESTGASASIHPNPAKTKLFLNTDVSEDSYYEIASIEGKLLQSGEVGEHAISIENLAPGLYFIKIRTDAGENVQRFVKE